MQPDRMDLLLIRMDLLLITFCAALNTLVSPAYVHRRPRAGPGRGGGGFVQPPLGLLGYITGFVNSNKFIDSVYNLYILY
jgi:hypothetical protein